MVIVDIILSDGPCNSVVEHLIDNGIPFVVHSGDHQSLHADTPFATGVWVGKPADGVKMLRTVRSLLPLGFIVRTISARMHCRCMDIADDDDRRPFALVVDDDVLILMDAAEILATAGFRPLEAHDVDGAELLLVEYADEIALLFTDVQMPGRRDGFDLARMTAVRWPEIGILVASGLANPDDGLMPEHAIFVRKPFHAERIYEHLQVLLPDGAKPEPLKRKIRDH